MSKCDDYEQEFVREIYTDDEEILSDLNFYRNHPFLNMLGNIKSDIQYNFNNWFESKFRINKLYYCDKCGFMVFPLKGELLYDDYGFVVKRNQQICHHCHSHGDETFTGEEWQQIVFEHNKKVIKKIKNFQENT
jgi:hypothetical protein